MKTLKQATFLKQEGNRVDIQCERDYVLHLYVLEQDVIRVAFTQKNSFKLDRTWAISPNRDDVPFEGRQRISTDGFSLPSYQFKSDGDVIEITTEKLKVRIHRPLALEWQYNKNGHWLPLFQERKTGAYQFGVSNHKIAHFITRSLDENCYGLGEKAGDLNRKGRRFEMRNLDAMGYNAEKTDPLYKHVPFYITRKNDVSYGIYYDNLAQCWFDLGNELDNYHIAYKSYRAEDGDMDYYVILGPTTLEVTKKYTALTGGTIFGPRWGLGYSGSTMSYTDADDAQEQLKKFVDLCKRHDIPCDSFQLSSGYTSINGKRYVFNWNYDKIPEPLKMSAHFRQAGMHLAANIKPCMLQDHPRYKEAQNLGLFIKDSESNLPERSVFWDDEGSHLDFTNPATIQWWKDNVKEQLLERGIGSTWNDNNEYEIWDDYAKCVGFGKEIPIKLIRALHPLLMMKASYEAQKEFAPNERPYLISRSGCSGMNRYVQTWSGDNRTNWTTLRYNIRMGLGMSLSGLYNVGHDVGGFSGDKPEPELFVRWVQNGIFHPRFTIHSWNDDKTVNEPWMYPEVTNIIRDTIKLRYKLMPYIYNIFWLSHKELEPMLRPTFLDHENDANTYAETDDYLFGKDLLIASVVEKGQRQREVYLPQNNAGWYDFYGQTYYQAGQTIYVGAPLERIPLFVKAGAVIPMSGRMAYSNPQADTIRELAIYPLKQSGEIQTSIYDDDGLTYGYKNGEYLQLNITLRSTQEAVYLDIQKQGHWKPAYQVIKLTLPTNETRQLIVNGTEFKKGTELSLAEIKEI
ncbi:glycoside hydrolase family 31 protein [Bisgaard Taxon 10/6]|uniref:glycoside hydrolase family 31 protein n=1 Tax=Exercitatus varius TaxID=67857 RepID=UPI00294ABCAE|nr:glycoside hydrolase family 31 protein [Exercitatus varius]MDG2957100.1 glycoside hydrolase family 31 protein [Exercitatus varius]MDG2964768.1 glycoside hydrolase family 31 protein [Exercitatus varius]